MGWGRGMWFPRATKGKRGGRSDSGPCSKPGFDSKIVVSAIRLDLPCGSKQCYMLPDFMAVTNQGFPVGKQGTTKESKSFSIVWVAFDPFGRLRFKQSCLELPGINCFLPSVQRGDTRS